MWVLPHLAELIALEFKHLIRTHGWSSCYKWLDGKGVWEREKSKRQFVLIMEMSAFLHWPHSGIKDKDSLFRLDVELPETLNPALLSSLCSLNCTENLSKLKKTPFLIRTSPLTEINFIKEQMTAPKVSVKENYEFIRTEGTSKDSNKCWH